MSVMLLDYCAQLFVEITIPVMRHRTVVCDRYVYDTVISEIAVDMNLSNDGIYELIDKCLKVVSKPSVNFVLDVDERTAFDRKADTDSIEYLQDRRVRYLQMAKHYGMYVLDANRNPIDVYEACITIIEDEFGI